MKHTWWGVLLSVIDISVGYYYLQTIPAAALIGFAAGLFIFGQTYEIAQALDEAEKKSKKASERK